MAPRSKSADSEAESSNGRKSSNRRKSSNSAGNSKPVAGILGSSPGSDPSVATRNTRLAQFNTATAKKAFGKAPNQGEVVHVDYVRSYGFLVRIGDDGPRTRVHFRASEPGRELTNVLTGGMLLIPGDVMDYELVNSDDSQKPRVAFAKLRICKPREVHVLVKYVESLTATAKAHPEIVLRDVTKCPTGFKLLLDFRNPPAELLVHTIELCQILATSKHAGLYHSRLKQMFALLNGSRFLHSEDGIGKLCTSTFVGDQSLRHLLKGFVIHLLDYSPSQLLLLVPVLTWLGACTWKSKSHSIISDELGRPCEAESFLEEVLNVLAGRNNEQPGSRPWSQLPLLPTTDEVRSISSCDRSTLPVVKQRGPYRSPEDYIDTYLRLLREDCFAGLLQGIRSLRAGKLDDCGLKLWFHVSSKGVHFNRNASPGLTFAVSLPPTKSKAPLSGSLVCLFDDDGGLDSPIWGVVSRCEIDRASKACVCFVEIVGHQSGAETAEFSSSVSLSFQCARLMRGDNMVLVESPTYYRAYQPVLNTLQLIDPHSIPFQDELVFVKWPAEPAPDYLKNPGATLDWSCIFDYRAGVAAGVPGEIREGIGALPSLPRRGYKTSFDPSQLKAVELAVNNRLTIIQGPPGTGKTYVGVKLLQLLMSASTFPRNSPVFVMTFKNHALDQFLEKCLSFCKGEDSLVRVGGRSKNHNLDKYNLFHMMAMARKDEFSSDRAENMRDIEGVQQKLEKALEGLNKCVLHFDPVMILEQASDLHLSYFLTRVSYGSSERINSIAGKLSGLGLTLGELLQGSILQDLNDPGLAADISNIKQRLVAEIRSWIPKSKVFQAARSFFAMKRPANIRTVPRDAVVACAKDAVDDEVQDESKKDEEERRRAYESLRQDINLDDERSDSKKVGWLDNNFWAFLEEKHVSNTSMAFLHLNVDFASQFDWLAYENPYDLSAEHRAILVYKYWDKSVDAACERLASIQAQYDTLLQDVEQIEKRRKLAILQKAKIIGMTTSGAAINQSLLKYLSPAVVLVEEAAEILEPQILASLNSNLQHLILIGDHHQLRPPVESYDLERWHGFGVSMFERIVEHNELPYQPLSLQCRMREEFVPMLLPIYPFLKSNIDQVSGNRNKAPTCMLQTMHFWSHEYQETSQRSYVNKEEAHMVVALARWIASELENPKSLTILAAYNGQVTLIHNLKEKHPELQEVEVHSIDKFQGAENEIVIVSLVRSNARGNIGHVSMRSRLCVAVSRARCGVYFVGNPTTLTDKSAHWRTLVSYFEAQNAISSSVPLCCPRHPKRPPYWLTNNGATKFEPKDVCDYPCQAVLQCGHACGLTCHFGSHIRSQCIVEVDFTFPLCGHTQTKMCCQVEAELRCSTVVMHTFQSCGHSIEKQCWEVKGIRKRALKCQVVCGKELQCGHICKLLCSEECDSALCQSCLEIEQEKERIRLQILIDAIASKRKELEVDIQKLKEEGDQGIVVTQVHPYNDMAQAFFMAKDRVEKYIHPDCKTVLVVTKVERIENQPLQRKFLEAQRELFNPLEISEWLFYGGPDARLGQIVNKGFRAANKKVHLFDVFSSSTAQEHDNHNLLLCEVHLGKTWRKSGDVEKELKELNRNRLREKGYDSVSLLTDPGNEGDQSRPWKHVVFNPEQAIPRFVVSFKRVDFQALATSHGYDKFGEEQASKTGGMCRLSLSPSLEFQGDGPEEYHFRMAESQFFRMSTNRRMKVTKVEVIINTTLKEIYLRKKEEFKASNKAVTERFVFHGTDSAAIGKIATEGFKIGGTEGIKIKSGASYGHGIYTAVDPDTSLAYCRGTSMMLLSLAIPGELNIHYNYGASNNIFVIREKCQLLPRYVVHYL